MRSAKTIWANVKFVVNKFPAAVAFIAGAACVGAVVLVFILT